MSVEKSSATDYHTPNATLTVMAMDYFRSRVVCAAARLGIADALGDGELPVSELATKCGAEANALHRLLRALASIGVVAETNPGRFMLTALGHPLRRDAEQSEWASVIFWADLLADNWAYLTECVRAGTPAAEVRPQDVPSRWTQVPEALDIFRAVMGTAPVEDYMPIVQAWNFSEYHTVADLGGGGGGLIAAILQTYPNIHGLLVDKPESIDAAAPRIEKQGLSERCKLAAADLSAGVPAGADVYILKSVLHGKTDKEAVKILQHCRSVMPANGRLLVIEFVLPDVIGRADSELELKLMSDLNMLIVTRGKERTAADWKTLLETAGFGMQSLIPVPGGSYSIVEASLI
jgi:hypothetical protein